MWAEGRHVDVRCAFVTGQSLGLRSGLCFTCRRSLCDRRCGVSMKTDGEVAILSVDVGTSATKAALFFPSSGTLGHVFRESYETCAGKNGKVTQRPEDWLEATLTASRNALDGSDAHVAAISVTGQMQNVIGAGKDKPLLLESDAILYSDARARVEARAISEATGMSIAATSILSKLRLLSQPRGESYELLLGAADYVLRGLSGNVGKGFTDATTASTTGLTLPPHRNYDEELLKATHLDAFLPHLPRILPAPMQVGSLSVHAAGALKKPCLAGIPLIHGAGDAYSATVGANSHRPHSGSYTYGGTSGWVGATVSETDRRSISPSVFQLAHGADAGLVLVAASVAAVGGALSHVARMMDVSTGDVAEMAERAPVGANGLVYMPYISGRRCPRRTDVSMGGFLGMRAEHGREEMARAAVEGVVYALAEAGVEGELVQKGVRIVGGVSKSDVFVRGLCAMIGEGRGYVGECDVGIVGAGKIAAGLCGIEVGEEGRWEEVVVGAEACEEWKHGWDRWRRAVDVCDSLAADK